MAERSPAPLCANAGCSHPPAAPSLYCSTECAVVDDWAPDARPGVAPPLRLVPPGKVRREEQRATRSRAHEAGLQAGEAATDLDRPASWWLHFPLRAIDELVGGMRPGVGFLAAFSGQGKTALTASLTKLWREEGKKVYVMPLESRPKVFRTEWACRDEGVHPGDALTGELRRRAEAGDAWAAEAIARLQRHLLWQDEPAQTRQIYVDPAEFIGPEEVRRACENAADFGADVLLIDHIDHFAGEAAGDERAESVATVSELDSCTKRMGVRALATTQLNNDAVRDPLDRYRPPQPSHVWLGGHKRQKCHWMLGAWRAMRTINVADADEVKAFKQAQKHVKEGGEPGRILEPGLMGIAAMKQRDYGEREWWQRRLKVERGMVRDLTPDELRAVEAAAHGIGTGGYR